MASIPETSLYMYFDACGTLLYVGITNHGDQRQRQHALTQAWWPLVRSSRVFHYPTREEARAAELEAIRRWQPPFNRGDNPEAWAAMVRYFLARVPMEPRGHEHATDEKYGRCARCGRCAPCEETSGVADLCERCQEDRCHDYEVGVAVGRSEGVALGDELAAAFPGITILGTD